MMIRGYAIGARLIAIAVGVILLVVAVGFTVRSCDSRHNKAAQSRLERAQGDARANSAADAVSTVAASGEAAAASEAQTRANEKDIRDAEGSTAPVNPAVRDAGLRALCVRAAYRDSERCRLFRAHP
jgi:hypothetical protein